MYICDGNALIQNLTGLPQTFGQLAEKIFDSLPAAQRIDFVTDTYMESSIKSAERRRRGMSQTFLVKGPSTKLPKDWKAFLTNNKNKSSLTKLLLEEWQKDRYAPKLYKHELFFVCEERCVCLTSLDGHNVNCIPVQELTSYQEEADTRMILHCVHADTTSDATDIVINPQTLMFSCCCYFTVTKYKRN